MTDERRTQFAMKALSFADTFNILVGKDKLEGAVRYRVEMSAPDGPSTAGGKQALQHVKLVPEKGGPVIVAGSANTVENHAELRTWEHLAMLHAERWKGASLPVDRARYAELVTRMQIFFAEQKMRVVLIDAPRATGRPTAPASRRASSSAPLWIGLAAALAIAFALVFFLLRAKHG